MSSPIVIYVMGVSGSGKTTVGQALSQAIGIPFLDGDDFHPPANIAKMQAGSPLTDDDRQGWLYAIHAAASSYLKAPKSGVIIACSALKATYRDILQSGIETHTKWVFLEGSFSLIQERLAARKAHFMPPQLLQSQFDILEIPANAIRTYIDQPLSEIISHIMTEIQSPLADFGLIGLGVMGTSIARNLAQKDISVSLYNRFVLGSEENIAQKRIQTYPELANALGFEDLQAFVHSLASPRKILLMVQAGKATDAVLEELLPLLSPGDVVIDGGNTYFKETADRQNQLRKYGIHWIGTGVSGGEKGALEGPSIMPSGDPEAYACIQPFLEKIAAKDALGNPCCAYMGKEGSGHFVKMVHNGIEYAEMQLLAEIYAILKYINGYSNEEIGAVFTQWTTTDLSSYLLEITAKIVRKKEGNGYLLDEILPEASSKGTGGWTTQTAVDLGIATPILTAALFARFQSEQPNFEWENCPQSPIGQIDIPILEEAYRTARLLNHLEGFELIQKASDTYHWAIPMAEMARIWTNGCIIRSVLMESLSKWMQVHSRISPQFMIDSLAGTSGLDALREVGKKSIDFGLGVPCLSAALVTAHTRFYAFPTAHVIQAQRDFFGAHTYKKTSDTSGKSYHTVWE